ncbi:hypothetical protein H9P43_000877 [Blastocladiella emersonii ATCC 22665]|nr:hypothetical protein H9P43_000877 [Blastocladiella emersonii ATCC 22665]
MYTHARSSALRLGARLHRPVSLLRVASATRTAVPRACWHSGLRRASATEPAATNHGFDDANLSALGDPSGGAIGGGASGNVTRLQGIVHLLCRRQLTPVTLPELLRIGRAAMPPPEKPAAPVAGAGTDVPPHVQALVRNAQFLQAELPVRLARRCKAFEELPFIVGINPHIQQTYNLYLESLDKLMGFRPIETAADETEYSSMLASLVDAHTDVIPTVSQGFLECRKYMPAADIGAFLDRLIMARIGVRVLAEHHLALHTPHPSFIGIVNTQLSPARVARQVFDYVSEVAEFHYGVATELVIDGMVDETLAYIPVHIEYILAELLKNSIRATVESRLGAGQHGTGGGGGLLAGAANSNVPLPAIRLTVAKSPQDVVLRIRDEGGGVPYDSLQKIFEYAYTTVKKRDPNAALDTASGSDPGDMLGYSAEAMMQQGIGGPIAGLGYGLGTASVYARYFGGSLRMVSLYGHGCDVFLRLPNIDTSMSDVKI